MGCLQFCGAFGVGVTGCIDGFFSFDSGLGYLGL